MVQSFPILGKASTTIEPSKSSFDNPPFRQNLKPHRFIRSLDNFDGQVGQNPFNPFPKFRSLITCIGKEPFRERKHAEHCRHHQHAAIAILNVGWVYQGMYQQAEGIDKNVPLFAFNLFARIKAWRIDLSPPFSALFTLWLSMMPAVGLAS